jgi:hypothetical protein
MADRPTNGEPRRSGGLDRRAFLTGTGLAGVTAATGGVALVQARETPDEQLKPRYAETDHVRRFYDMNRL